MLDLLVRTSSTAQGRPEGGRLRGRPQPLVRGSPMNFLVPRLRDSEAPRGKILESLINELKPNNLEREYLCSRWRRECLEMGHLADVNRRYFYRLRFSAVCSSVTVPALVGLDLAGSGGAIVQWATFSLSLVAALSTALLQLFRFGEKWRLYRYYYHRLTSAGWYFAERNKSYKTTDSPNGTFHAFVDEVEKTLNKFEAEYQADAIILRDENDREYLSTSTTSGNQKVAENKAGSA